MIVKKINELALDIQKTPYKYWLNIMKRYKNNDTYYVICGFDYKDEDDMYELNSIGDRLKEKNIDWFDLGILVNLGYKILSSNTENLEELYNKLKIEKVEE